MTRRPVQVLAALLPLLVAGCVIVPTPEHGLLAGRGMIDQQTVDTLQPGVTTREEVLLRFGEPDAALKHQQVFVYCWTRIQGYFAYAVGGGYSGAAGGGPIGKVHLLLIEFDERGCLQRRNLTGPGWFQDAIDCADDWAGLAPKPAP